MTNRYWIIALVCLLFGRPTSVLGLADYEVSETDGQIAIVTPQIEASIAKQGYVSGVMRQSFLDKKTGFRDPGFGLDIVDFLLEPMSDAAYRERLPEDLRYDTGNMYHGEITKRFVEGPQICTRARRLRPKIFRGKDFVAIRQHYKYHRAIPGRQPGSVWTQVLVLCA